jgi:long-chain acyl-CoA synthetase
MNLGKMLEKTRSAYGKKVALISEDKRLIYDELDKSVNALANTLKRLGIQKGDKVAMMLPNIPEFVISYFAALKLGAVAVTINTMSTSYELSYLIENSDSKVFITTAMSARKFDDIKPHLHSCGHLILADGASDTALSFNEILEKGPFDFEIPQIDGDDPAVMIYTSGLTGKPLGAVLTHANLLSQSILLETLYNGTQDDRGLGVIPLFHSFGAVANMLAPIRIGASMVIVDQFHLESIFKIIEEEKITYFCAVPRVFLGMILHEETKEYNLSTVRFCITGGSAMPPAYIPRFEKKFGIILREGYGLTEASPICSVSRLSMVGKPGSIGVPIPGVEIKIFDEDGNELPSGQVGELVVKGVNVMKGYYKDEEATGEVIRNGWLHTGDLACVDEDGYIFIKGLKKRMIITSGFNVYPREVEIVLNMYPGVEDSRVMSKADLMRGETVKARVVKKDPEITDRMLLKHCRKYLSSYKVPREIEFVESLS